MCVCVCVCVCVCMGDEYKIDTYTISNFEAKMYAF